MSYNSFEGLVLFIVFFQCGNISFHAFPLWGILTYYIPRSSLALWVEILTVFSHLLPASSLHSIFLLCRIIFLKVWSYFHFSYLLEVYPSTLFHSHLLYPSIFLSAALKTPTTCFWHHVYLSAVSLQFGRTCLPVAFTLHLRSSVCMFNRTNLGRWRQNVEGWLDQEGHSCLFPNPTFLLWDSATNQIILSTHLRHCPYELTCT